ncbi:hypothetical protein PB01_04065 [Psychrobacillus glaciei]|uniref:Uncharacterized protein n=1 Tax=Psychrobacillus glaciei TaxID=2283160 RepID=A0A5J6SJP9_9BACI|nr:PD-(D/E)XK nuclease family transposase [Psychrobacillus glaciei]QFF98058.1 hypothetical protein PB01_04065 [Psychrobacillus glaciei]
MILYLRPFFGSKRSNHLLRELLNAVLEDKIISVEIRNTNFQMMHSNDKASSMDLCAIMGSGEQINIEMQEHGHRALPEIISIALKNLEFY